jgi:hypothetical protein
MLLGGASAWGSGEFAPALATWMGEVSVQLGLGFESKLQEGVSAASPEADLLEEPGTT